MPQVELVKDVRNQIGECPIWSVEEQALYWEDIEAPAIYRWVPETDETTTWPMPSPVGAFGFRASGGLIVGLRSGIHFFDPKTGDLTFVVDPEPDHPTNRLNDGKVGPDGRFWIGSMFDVPGVEREPTGALYCIEPDGTCRKVLDGLYVSNGLAWSPDGRTMYHSDSGGNYIKAYDYDLATGEIANSRVIARPGEPEGRPDGAAVDIEGDYWSAGVSAGCINRYGPDGSLVEKLELRTPCPTMCCFGGPDLRTLYITSLRRNPELIAKYPTSGGVFMMRVDVPGLADNFYTG